MLKQFFQYMYGWVEVMKEYDHLVEHDSVDCEKEGGFGCWFRKYGATVVGMGVLISLSVWGFMRKMEAVI